MSDAITLQLEKGILLEIYERNRIDKDITGKQKNWNAAIEMKEWKGVEVNQAGFITKLDLSGRELKGTIIHLMKS